MAVSGRKALIKVSGAAASFTDEACTTVTANTVYQITDSAKRVWDRTATITVKKNAVTQAANLYTLNRLTGTVTFLSDIGGGNTITVSGSYLPMSTAAESKAYDYSLEAQNVEIAKYGDTFIPRIQGMKDASGSVGRWKTDTYFSAALVAGAPVVLEFWSDSSAAFDVRVWGLLNTQQVQAAVEGAVEESVGFMATPDVDGRTISG